MKRVKSHDARRGWEVYLLQHFYSLLAARSDMSIWRVPFAVRRSATAVSSDSDIGSDMGVRCVFWGRRRGEGELNIRLEMKKIYTTYPPPQLKLKTP